MAHDPTTAPLLQLSAVRKSYNVGQPSEAEVLHGIDLQLRASEFIALVGPSGSGKSTLRGILIVVQEQQGLCRKTRQALPAAIRKGMEQCPEIAYALLDEGGLFEGG